MEKMQPVLEYLGRDNERLKYIGRPESASPATGLMSKHLKEQAKLLEEALNLSNRQSKNKKNKN